MKDTGKKVTRVELNARNKHVSTFIKNTWVDSIVMHELAKHIVSKKQQHHGNDRILLFYDNLIAHLDSE
eukprot:11337487-Ditylum_brightwellii.AAC.1